jgi:uncharacterized circularly permuted ATP-grasp superfamily protein
MSEEKTSKSTLTLSESDRTDLSNVIEESVFGMEGAPEPEFLNAFIEKYTLLIAEGVHWGFGDTVVREQVADSCSKMLINRHWPDYNETLSDEQWVTFMKDLKAAHDEFVAKTEKRATVVPSPTESTLTLSEADRIDLSNVIQENVLEMEGVPAPEFLDAFIEKHPLLIAEGVNWGFGDTEVRGQVVSCCSKMLIGRSWPTYGDKLSDEEMETFTKDLKKSYAEFVAKNKK